MAEKKATAYRLTDETLRDIETMSGRMNLNATQYVERAIMEQVKRDKLEAVGGMTASYPNPQIYLLSDDDKLRACEILNKAANDLAKLNPTIAGCFGIHALTSFAAERLFSDTDSQRNAFMKACAVLYGDNVADTD